MTKETKIGLLVGLAFIILFAIILSEKGATRGTSAPSGLSLADAAARGGRAIEVKTPLAKAGRLPVESLLNRAETDLRLGEDEPVAISPESLGLVAADPAAMSALLPEPVVAKLNQPLEGESQSRAHLDEAEQATVSLEDALAAALEKEEDRAARQGDDPAGPGFLSQSSGLAEETLVSRIEEEDLDSAGRHTTADGGGTPPKAEEAISIRAVHTVASGENLGKIAARYYGRSTPARIEAIFNANRDILTDIHKVRAEDELKIPALAVDADDPFEATPDFAPAQVVSARGRRMEPGVRIPVPVEEGAFSEGQARAPRAEERLTDGSTKRESPAPKFQWYEIRKDDTLSSIARRELGNEKRFLELFRMNRDLIENRDRIKPGTKIRLPVHEAASTTPLVVVSSGDVEADAP